MNKELFAIVQAAIAMYERMKQGEDDNGENDRLFRSVDAYLEKWKGCIVCGRIPTAGEQALLHGVCAMCRDAMKLLKECS